jgi:hypothetical protein
VRGTTVVRKIVVAFCAGAGAVLLVVGAYLFYWPIASFFGVHATFGNGDEADGYLARKAYRECGAIVGLNDSNPPTEPLEALRRYGGDKGLVWMNCVTIKVYGNPKK